MDKDEMTVMGLVMAAPFLYMIIIGKLASYNNNLIILMFLTVPFYCLCVGLFAFWGSRRKLNKKKDIKPKEDLWWEK